MMDNVEQQKPNRARRLPHPRWLAVAAIALAVWAIALGVWWRQINAAATTPRPAPVAQATRVSATAQRPQAVASATPRTTPATVPVVRPGEPSAAVLAGDWPALARTFDGRRALADIAELIRPQYAGRATGSPGSKLAADWIADRFREYGLQPAGDGGTYFQDYHVPYAELTAMPTFALLNSAGIVQKEYRLRRDYMFWPGGYADGGQAEGPVIWVSNGAHADYKGLDVQGAIVLCRWRFPLQDSQREALEHGARAIIFYRPEYNMLMRRTAREDAILPQGIPTLLVGTPVVQELLSGSGMTADDLSIQYQSRPLTRRVRIDLPLEFDANATGRNVLGVLPGSDPNGLQQVVIIGGHYDHLGADPDGTQWPGANDDASGVAAFLEIARQWHEQGYVPKRTVLFAAWDAEEIGLNGSTYYVQHPAYPLTQTVGMLQLDMVGAGPNELHYDSSGLVAQQTAGAAEALSMTVQGMAMGGSDHVPFAQANVPASAYIWWDETSQDIIYHVPADDINNIDPARLQAAGELADLVLLNLSWDLEEMEGLTSELQQAISASDVATFVDLLDPDQPTLRQKQQTWLEAVRVRQPAEYLFESGMPTIRGDTATSAVTLSYRWRAQDTRARTVLEADWVRRGGSWYYAGPSWRTLAGRHVQVEYLVTGDAPQDLVPVADALCERVERDVGPVLDSSGQLAIRLYPANALLQGLEMPPAGYEGALSWPADGGLVLNHTSALTTTLLDLALQRAGWPAAASSWLAQGVAEAWSAGTAEARERLGAQYIPLLLQADADKTLWSAENMPARRNAPAGKDSLWDAQAWAMSAHVLSTGDLRDPATDVAGWTTALLAPWRTAADGVARTLQERAQAVLGGNEAAFLATVDAADTVLLTEERHWFADLQSHPVSSFALTGKLAALREDHALVQVSMSYQLAAAGSAREMLIWQARFVPRDGRWLYADVAFEQQRSTHMTLKYVTQSQGALASRILSDAERAYEVVASDLDLQLPGPVEIKFYDNPDLFRASIFLSMPAARGWNEPGESVKLTNVFADDIGRIIAHELTHAVLFAMGVQHGGLHEGTAQYEAGLYSPRWQTQQVRRWREQVYNVVRSNRDITLQTLDDWRVWQVSDPGLMYNWSWDSVTYFRQRFGRETFLRWLHQLGTGLSFEDSFARATGISFAEFNAAWRESVLRGHIAPAYIETAQATSGERALEHVRALTQPAWGGREVGTAGNLAAAQYVAGRFVEYGLQPAGADGNLMQLFAVNSTRLAAMPELALLTADGQTRVLQYRTEWVEVVGGAAGSGQAVGEIVYVADPATTELHLGGRIMLARTNDPSYAASQAQKAGAGALLLATDKWPKDVAVKASNLAARSAATIPVGELTVEAYEALLKLAGIKAAQLANAPPALPLGLSARISVRLGDTMAVTAANVLGVLPGSDPTVAGEAILLGASLDGVGGLPDGTLYPGANHNASGVSVLLEIARTWHERGYHPRRTVIFAAWNAAEQGQKGSDYYVSHPAYPLTQTRAVIQLDTVGQGRGFYLTVAADEAQDALILAHMDNAARQVEGRWNQGKYDASGDQNPFHLRGVPATLITWERAEYTNTLQDSADLIDPNKLQATARLVGLAVMTMAEE